jgi:pimeloyl-ACP methyl ester carboxylesterase
VATVVSQDGTSIAFDRAGRGPAVILVNAGPTDRNVNAALAGLLTAQFTVINYDRRGRGDSGDTEPYAVDREYEDLDAVIDAAGGSAFVFGNSGGGILALEAAARGLAITKLAVWEPPYILDGTRPPVPKDYRQQLSDLLAAGRRGDMVELFMTQAVGLPAEFVASLRASPFFPSMEVVAHALVYDAMIVGDFSLPTRRLATVKAPTLVVDGGQTPWLTTAAEAVATALPDAQRRTLEGQPHNVDAAALAPVVADFLLQRLNRRGAPPTSTSKEMP